MENMTIIRPYKQDTKETTLKEAHQILIEEHFELIQIKAAPETNRDNVFALEEEARKTQSDAN